jgi:hypothetical protein
MPEMMKEKENEILLRFMLFRQHACARKKERYLLNLQLNGTMH